MQDPSLQFSIILFQTISKIPTKFLHFHKVTWYIAWNIVKIEQACNNHLREHGHESIFYVCPFTNLCMYIPKINTYQFLKYIRYVLPGNMAIVFSILFISQYSYIYVNKLNNTNAYLIHTNNWKFPFIFVSQFWYYTHIVFNNAFIFIFHVLHLPPPFQTRHSIWDCK